MLGHLVPEFLRLRLLGDRIENEKPVRRKTSGLMRQAFERGDEKAGDEKPRKQKVTCTAISA
jgi:hypothetical protein